MVELTPFESPLRQRLRAGVDPSTIRQVFKSLLQLILIALILSACRTDPGSASKKICMPDDIAGVMGRIERREESKQALDLVKRFQSMGRDGAVAAIYEFYMFRNKPVFFFVSAPVSLERKQLLDDAIAALHGDAPEKDAHELQSDGVTFLCRDFTRGRGLVGLSAACAWSDATGSGYGVRIDGGATEDTLRYTVEARRSYLRRAARAACEDNATLSALADTPATLENVARDVVAAIKGYKCNVLASYYASGAEELFRARIHRDHIVTMSDPVERVCFVLGTLGYPQSETMKVRRISEAETGVKLELSAHSLLADQRAELWLVKQGNEWKVDPQWALTQVYNHVAKLRLMSEASNLQSHFLTAHGFSDDKDTITSTTHFVSSVSPGLATDTSGPEQAYVKIGGSDYGCVSLRSESGEFLMVRIDRDGMTRARTANAPTECPAKRLGNDW